MENSNTRYQPWLKYKIWKKHDPKSIEAAGQPFYLNHTRNLAEAIPLKPAGIVMIRGPRQVGKSTFLREFAEKTLKSKIKPENLVLFDAERFADRHEAAGEVASFCREAKGYKVILIDEITSLDKWWLALKVPADSGDLLNALVVCTGSSSLELSQGADLLPGRRGKRHPVDFELMPLRYKEVAAKLSLEEFLLTGGFPWTINEYLKLGTIPPYVYQLHYSWIEGALSRSGHTVRHLPFLLNRLAVHQASDISVQKLSRDCGIGSNSTGETYLSVLEGTYALMSSSWLNPETGVPAPRKNRKFYPIDPFLFHLFSEAGRGWEPAFLESRQRLKNPELMGRMIEGLVASELRKRYPTKAGYWQGNREIDFIAGDFAVEVKFRNRVSIGEFDWANNILPPGRRLLVITPDKTAKKDRVELVTLNNWLLDKT